jgi:hypothetical protein
MAVTLLISSCAPFSWDWFYAVVSVVPVLPYPALQPLQHSFSVLIRRRVAMVFPHLEKLLLLLPRTYLLDNLPASFSRRSSGKRSGLRDTVLGSVRAAIQSVRSQMAEG